ncbi:fumarylacetoacetate hydrolase family protein [Paracoccus aerodenitrificans]|uniref:fumarylacetoacetate hydrolase family protein n=1 Tax=Paracoccus aerodenitrificans TaxID=3017781 RepID=UPI0022F037E2|nr:fumarylacetoacetate hydrolase family protein [Paracoccus aerodenitrificans]WBU65082.1 fumarylacetoacetate hydrolase family protein [Paracoccus aerodenitrificans]
MAQNLFPSPPLPALPVQGQEARYPLHRIFCVGKNYAAHAAEMGGQVDREQPIFFTKSALAYLPSGMESNYPPGTSNYHYEVELCVAVGKPLFKADIAAARDAVFGYAVGLDMTRRDLQSRAKDGGLPWDTAKDVEESAIIGPITQEAEFGPLADQRIRLRLDGELRQDAPLSDMVWSIPELLSRLSHLYHLAPGDILMTGTPAGVGPVSVGNHLVGDVEGLAPVSVTFTEPDQP